MLKTLRESPKALLLSIIVHLAVVALLVVSLQWRPSLSSGSPSTQPVIQAVAVNEKRVEQEMKKLQAAHAKRQAAEQQRQRAAQRALEQAQRKRQAEEQQIAELKKQQAAEQAKRLKVEQQQRLAAKKAEQAREAAQAAEQKRLADLRKQREAEQQRLAALEAKRKMEEKQRREAEEKQRRAEEQKALQAQLAAEQQRLEAAKQRLGQQAIAKYTDLIKQKVARNWLMQPGWQKLHCTVQVRLIPTGDVADVQVVATSGDPAFDRSVETAVRKAAPLPLPSDPGLFEEMRTITFVFDPSKG